MPYISPKDRERLDYLFDNFVPINTTGELNYIITKCVNEYLKTRDFNYDSINDIIGALEGAKLEFYRTQVGPYEDKKIILNGDVYEYSS